MLELRALQRALGQCTDTGRLDCRLNSFQQRHVFLHSQNLSLGSLGLILNASKNFRLACVDDAGSTEPVAIALEDALEASKFWPFLPTRMLGRGFKWQLQLGTLTFDFHFGIADPGSNSNSSNTPSPIRSSTGKFTGFLHSVHSRFRKSGFKSPTWNR